MDNDTIGLLGVTAISTFLAYTRYIKPDIRHHDNIPIWDGDLYVYNTPDDMKNSNFSYRIPTQVKSHEFNEAEFPESANFDIEIQNLHKYLDEGCVVFFYVFIRPIQSVNSSKIYVKFFSRKVLKDTIKSAKGKSTVRINLTPIPEQTDELLINLRRLHLQRKHKTISLEKLVSETPIEIITEPTLPENLTDVTDEQKKEYKRVYLATHSIDFLIVNPDNPEELLYPEEGPIPLCVSSEIKEPISIAHKIVRQSYKRVYLADGIHLLVDDGWFEIVKPYSNAESSAKVNIILKPLTFKDIIGKVKFIYNYINSKEINFGSETFPLPTMENNQSKINELKSRLKFWLELEQLCVCLHVYTDFDISNLSSTDFDHIKMLKAAYIDKVEVTSFMKENHITFTNVGELKIYSYAEKLDNGKFRLFDLNERLCVGYLDNDKYVKAPIFTGLFSYEHIPSNINFADMLDAYTECLNENSNFIERANLDLLNLIKHFDLTGCSVLIDNALILADWIIEHSDSNEFIYKTNRLQVLGRKNKTLSSEDINWLYNAYDDDTIIDGNILSPTLRKFACAVLLKESHRAQALMLRITSEELDMVKSWPIYHLYENLIEQHNG